MKQFIFLCVLVCSLSFSSFAQQEQEIDSKITQVTVFTQDAQVQREGACRVLSGQTIVKFTGLSPYILKESIRVEGGAGYTIISVQHQHDFINELEKRKDIEDINSKIEKLKAQIEDEKTYVRIAQDKIEFLHSNKVVGGKEQGINPETFKSLHIFFGSNLELLYLEVLKRNRAINEYKDEILKLNNQLISLNSKSKLPSGTVLVTVESKQEKNISLKLNYLVKNATWYPSYDIRFVSLNKPLDITYKANIKQNTGVDWEDVYIVLSTAQTDISAILPELHPYYLEYLYPEIRRAMVSKPGMYAAEKSKDFAYNEIEEEPEVLIRGRGTIGDATPLYVVDGVPQKSISNIDPSEIAHVEVLKDASATAMYGSRGANGVMLITTIKNADDFSAPLTITSKREISNEYSIEVKQTIVSNNKKTTINYKQASLSANFEYQSIPKLSEHVFLIAKISDWYSAEFIDGMAHIYMENAYVGETEIYTEQFKDTMEISFGIDNNISIEREKMRDFSKRQFIGSNTTETIGYTIRVRNNKSYPITTKIFDQVPVSKHKEITVEIIELSGGTYNSETGKVEWKTDLQAHGNKEIKLTYSVKYPKDKKVIVE
ncbi:MAG: DUF4139 domain-containing protein [Bacteroidales bacterium]|nr:DUF4139 domain-containing protein [Bacteroidales bacterium]